jgi:3-oxoacyl-[acyl-carrier-protein] synthase II
VTVTSEVQYIHYHGTSTELNDRIETRAVKLAFNGHAYKLAGSSLKSMIGHPQGACGAAGIAATLLTSPTPDANCRSSTP